ncbi:pyridoxal phosphate-dependent aminotransferase [Streptomyces sp. NPDC058398]|uniref:pyridoxal phosphate-dependent aminotransferase n=1 Tax=Streptomyces sp. NPDC058398 TaxID=3346479 RepID=UPI00364A61A1
MSELERLAASRLRRVPVYRPGAAAQHGTAGRLSSNEAALGPAPAIRAAVAALGTLHRYPDAGAVAAHLAEDVGVTAEQILLTNGSDELCYLLATLLLGPGRTAVVGDPCYQIDATASLLSGADLRRVPLVDGAHDLPAMVRAAQDASVVWLPSPHNPTGVACDPQDLETFLNEVPPTCAVVLDEAYRAFTDPGLRPDIPRLLSRHPHLVVQRTLSKDWALAGLRVGYVLASQGLVRALRRARPPFSVNSVALAALHAGLGQEAWRGMAVDRVRHERTRLEHELGRVGIRYFPSQASFVTARIDHARIAPPLAASRIAVRPGEDLGLPGWVRISIGWAPQMALVRQALRRTATVPHQQLPERSAP